MRFNTLLVGVAALSVTACAFGDETLTLDVDGTLRPGLLQEATTTTVTVADATDGRGAVDPVGKPDHKDMQRPAFVGYKRNGYGQKTANIVTDRPVTDVVTEALVRMLEKNGHQVGEDAPLRFETTITAFDLDMKSGLVTVEFIGSVEADVRLLDTRTGQELYSGSFRGNETRKTGGGLSGTWTTILNEALADMVRRISLTPEIKDAFDAAGQPMAALRVEVAA